MAKPFKSQFDLMAEAYGKVNYSKQRIISEHSSARKVRGYEPKLLTEAHCDEETSESVELGGDLYEVGAPDPSNESELIISIVKHDNGYMITTGQFSSPEDFVTKGPDSAIEAGGYALSLEGQPMDEDDLEDRSSREEDRDADPFRHEGMTDIEAEDADADPFRHEDAEGEHSEEQPGEDFFDALDDVIMITGTENAHAVVGGMEVKLGRKLSPLETEHCHEMIQDDELPDDDPYKGEGDAEGYQGYR